MGTISFDLHHNHMKRVLLPHVLDVETLERLQKLSFYQLVYGGAVMQTRFFSSRTGS